MKGTHRLESTEGGTSQNNKRKQVSKKHSLAGDRRARNKLGTAKERERARGTHFLKSAEGKTSQGQRKEAREQGTLTD